MGHVFLRAGVASARLWFVAALFLAVWPGSAQADDAGVLRGRALYLAGDYDAALAILIPAAEAGDATAQNIYGAALDAGHGVARDVPAAMDWWAKSAAQGEPRAWMNMAINWRDGAPGVAVDAARAREAYRMSADLGYGPAFAGLGHLIDNGIGGPADPVAATALFEQGRAAGDPWAVEHMAQQYLNGRGVALDEARARALFSEAAVMGLAQAQGNLGLMLHDGIGGPVDLDGARDLYGQAMAQGYGRAGVHMAWLIAENPDLGDAIDPLAHCLWALERATKSERGDWQADCNGFAADLDAAAQAEAAQRAAAL